MTEQEAYKGKGWVWPPSISNTIIEVDQPVVARRSNTLTEGEYGHVLGCDQCGGYDNIHCKQNCSGQFIVPRDLIKERNESDPNT